MEYPSRKPQRLKDYDYSQPNYYFVTICTNGKQPLFGMPNDPTPMGQVVNKHVLKLEAHFPAVRVDCFTVMPDHIHLILAIGCDEEAERASPFPTLPVVIGSLKSGISKEIHLTVPNLLIWQKSYYDRVVRPNEYQTIRRYIEENSLKKEWLEENH